MKKYISILLALIAVSTLSFGLAIGHETNTKNAGVTEHTATMDADVDGLCDLCGMVVDDCLSMMGDAGHEEMHSHMHSMMHGSDHPCHMEV